MPAASVGLFVLGVMHERMMELGKVRHLTLHAWDFAFGDCAAPRKPEAAGYLHPENHGAGCAVAFEKASVLKCKVNLHAAFDTGFIHHRLGVSYSTRRHSK